MEEGQQYGYDSVGEGGETDAGGLVEGGGGDLSESAASPAPTNQSSADVGGGATENSIGGEEAPQNPAENAEDYNQVLQNSNHC